jgi:hypothetical protein
MLHHYIRRRHKWRLYKRFPPATLLLGSGQELVGYPFYGDLKVAATLIESRLEAAPTFCTNKFVITIHNDGFPLSRE